MYHLLIHYLGLCNAVDPKLRTMSGKAAIATTVSGSISASTPACHAGERGSTPRQRDYFPPFGEHLFGIPSFLPKDPYPSFFFSFRTALRVSSPGDHSIPLQEWVSYESCIGSQNLLYPLPALFYRGMRPQVVLHTYCSPEFKKGDARVL